MRRADDPWLLPEDFRAVLFAAVAAGIVLGGEVFAYVNALGGGTRATVVFWLAASAMAAFVANAYGVAQAGAARRVAEAAALALAVVLVPEPAALERLASGFGVDYAAAVGVGAALALPGRTAVRLAVRVAAVPASIALLISLDRATRLEDVGFVLPAVAVFAVGLVDVAADMAGRGRLVLAAAVLALPVAALAANLLLEERRAERERRTQELAAQPVPARVGQERVAWMFPARGSTTARWSPTESSSPTRSTRCTGWTRGRGRSGGGSGSQDATG